MKSLIQAIAVLSIIVYISFVGNQLEKIVDKVNTHEARLDSSLNMITILGENDKALYELHGEQQIEIDSIRIFDKVTQTLSFTAHEINYEVHIESKGFGDYELVTEGDEDWKNFVIGRVLSKFKHYGYVLERDETKVILSLESLDDTNIKELITNLLKN